MKKENIPKFKIPLRIDENNKSSLNMASIGEAIGVTREHFQQIKSGSKGGTLKNIYNIAQAIGCRPCDLLPEEWQKPEIESCLTKAPILNKVSAGQMQEVCEIPAMGYLQYPTKKKTIFALKVDGDSMNEIAPNGSYAIVDYSQKSPSDLVGKAVIAASDEHDATFKIYNDKAGKLFLQPKSTNPKHKPIEICDSWYIVGRVIGVVNPLDDEFLSFRLKADL